jgi:hypothetical protein
MLNTEVFVFMSLLLQMCKGKLSFFVSLCMSVSVFEAGRKKGEISPAL